MTGNPLNSSEDASLEIGFHQDLCKRKVQMLPDGIDRDALYVSGRPGAPVDFLRIRRGGRCMGQRTRTRQHRKDGEEDQPDGSMLPFRLTHLSHPVDVYFSRPASVRLSFICMYRNEISSFHIKNISRLFTSDGDSVKNS